MKRPVAETSERINFECSKLANTTQLYAFIKLFKIFLSSIRENESKKNKSITSSMFDAKNISARRYVRHVRLHCLQNYFNAIKVIANSHGTSENLRILTGILPKFCNNI